MLENFERHCALHVRDALRRSPDLFDEVATRDILAPPSINEKLEMLFLHARDAESPIYNTDMVLYYMQHSVPNRSGPDNLIDANVRIDYGKLRHLLAARPPAPDSDRGSDGRYAAPDHYRSRRTSGRSDTSCQSPAARTG